MKGELERIHRGVLVGWVRDETRPERQVTFDPMVNEEVVGSFVADRERPDVAQDPPSWGFEVEIRHEWLQKGRNLVSAWARPEGVLIGRPLTTRRKQPAPAAPAAPAKPAPAPVASAEPAPPPAAPPAPAPAEPEPVHANVAHAPRAAVDYLDRPGPREALRPESVNADSLRIALDAISAHGGDLTPSLEKIVDRLFRKRLWSEVVAVSEHFRAEVWNAPRMLAWYGRALLYLREPEAAAVILARLRELRPERHGDVFYLGLALARSGRRAEALEVLEACIAHDRGKAKYHYEAGRILLQIVFGRYGLLPEDRAALDKAVGHFRTALQLERRDWRYYREL